jgi:hypothetical protein
MEEKERGVIPLVRFFYTYDKEVDVMYCRKDNVDPATIEGEPDKDNDLIIVEYSGEERVGLIIVHFSEHKTETYTDAEVLETFVRKYLKVRNPEILPK